MKLPENLKIHTCFKCKASLADENFNQCGVSLLKPQLVFDYECPTCGHYGRYNLDLKTKMTPIEALNFLAALMEMEKIQQDSEKGNIRSQLNKISGVQDLLRLGGNDAPKERTKRDGSDLP